MGLKSGSRDAGLDETEDEKEQSTEQEASKTDTPDEEIQRSESTSPTSEPETPDSTEDQANTESSAERPTMNSLPYKLRRNKVNEGREQVPYFLREEIIDAEEELQDTLEDLLDENVYKSDYREAAMVVAQRNPELVAEVLREWGYDLEVA